MKHTPAEKPAQEKQKSFRDFCQSPAITELELDPELVAWIRRAMQPAEMSGISNLEELNRALRLRRTKLRFPDELSWNRAILTVKAMWISWKG
jgi:hypothetical protein